MQEMKRMKEMKGMKEIKEMKGMQEMKGMKEMKRMKEMNIRKFQLLGQLQQSWLYSVYKERKINLISSCGNFLFYLFLSMTLFCFFNVAQADQKKKVRKKRVVIDFQDELLEGTVSNPSIFHLFHKKQMNYGRLIKFRKNFLPEMRRTTREI